jgi:hypothetical protein
MYFIFLACARYRKSPKFDHQTEHKDSDEDYDNELSDLPDPE